MVSYVTSSSIDSSINRPVAFPISKSALVVKIGKENTASIKLFEKIGFKIIKVVEIFGEVEMRFSEG